MGMILHPIIGIVLNGAALYALTSLVPEVTYTGGYQTFILGGLIVGLINSVVKPFIKLLSLPLIFLSGGLFLIVINVGVFWFLSYFLEVAQFRDVTLIFSNTGSYVIGAIVFGALNWAMHLIIKNN